MQFLFDFFKTKLGKIVGTVALIIIAVTVTVGTYIITNNQDKKEKKIKEEPSIVVAATTETTTEAETETTTEKETETTTEETTVEETTTEEITTEEPSTIEIIPIEDLDVGQGDEVGEDAEIEKEVIVEAEPETEKKTEKETEKETEEETTAGEVEEIPEQEAPEQQADEYSALVHGIDVSKHQGEIDWAQVKAGGCDFAIIRCGYRGYETGALAIDEKFQTNIEWAIANDIPVGIYFFSQATTVREAQEEASLVLSLIKDYNITYPVVFDWETSTGWRTDINLSVSTMTAMADTYLTMMEQAGYKGMLYGNKYDLERFDYTTLSKKYKIWHARYPAKYQYSDKNYVEGEETPELFCPYQMWQYKSTGKVPGINGDVDMNVAFFAYSSSDAPPPTLKIELQYEEIRINAGAKYNLKDGVTASNSAGIDISKYVVYQMYNEKNIRVSEATLLNIPGTYKIIYYVKDFTGTVASKEATVIVRGKPSISLKNTSLTWFATTDAEGVSDNQLALAVEARLQEIIANNILSATDYEGNKLTDVVVKDPSPLYLVNNSGKVLANKNNLTNAVLKPGEYVFGFSVTDDMGLIGAASMKLHLVSLTSDKLEIPLSEFVIEVDTDLETETASAVEETTSMIEETTSLVETSLSESESAEGDISSEGESTDDVSVGETTTGDGNTLESGTEELSSEDTTPEETTTEETTPEETTTEETTVEIITPVVYVDQTALKEYLMANISADNIDNFDINYDDALTYDMAMGSVSSNKEYQIRYIMKDMDAEKFYKICTVVFVDE